MGATKWMPETTNKCSTNPTSKWMHQPREKSKWKQQQLKEKRQREVPILMKK